MSDRIAITMILYNETFKVLSTNMNVCVCVCVCLLSEIACYMIVLKAYINFLPFRKYTARQKMINPPKT